MGNSSKPAVTTTVQKNDPWAPAQPALQDIIGRASSLYGSGVGSQVYGGQRLAGFGTNTQDAMTALERDARAGPSQGVTSGINFANGLLGSGGMSSGESDVLSRLRSIPGIDLSGISGLVSGYGAGNGVTQTANKLQGGAYDVNTEGDYRGLLSQAGGPSMTEQNLSGVARGDFLDPSKGNPYLDELINQSATDAGNQVAGRFAASGRYGSGNFAGAIAKATGDIATRTRAAEYDQERQRQVDANTAIDAGRLQRLGLSQGLLGDITGIQRGNTAQRVQGAQLEQSQTAQELAARQALAGNEQANAGLELQKASTDLSAQQGAAARGVGLLNQLPMLEQLRQMPMQQLMGLGSMQDQQRQAELDNERQIFQERQQSPWQQLGLYQAAVQPIGGMGGTTNATSTQQPAQPSGMQQLMGGLLGGAGLLGMTGAFPRTAAGGAGWLSSLFGR